MAWRRPGDKPLSEPMMVILPTHICVTRPQWVKPVGLCGPSVAINKLRLHTIWFQGPRLLTSYKFNPSMDKWPYAQLKSSDNINRWDFGSSGSRELVMCTYYVRVIAKIFLTWLFFQLKFLLLHKSIHHTRCPVIQSLNEKFYIIQNTSAWKWRAKHKHNGLSALVATEVALWHDEVIKWKHIQR